MLTFSKGFHYIDNLTVVNAHLINISGGGAMAPLANPPWLRHWNESAKVKFSQIPFSTLI